MATRAPDGARRAVSVYNWNRPNTNSSRTMSTNNFAALILSSNRRMESTHQSARMAPTFLLSVEWTEH